MLLDKESKKYNFITDSGNFDKFPSVLKPLADRFDMYAFPFGSHHLGLAGTHSDVDYAVTVDSDEHFADFTARLSSICREKGSMFTNSYKFSTGTHKVDIIALKHTDFLRYWLATDIMMGMSDEVRKYTKLKSYRVDMFQTLVNIFDPVYIDEKLHTKEK